MATAASAARAPKQRSLWWRVHAWAGLKLSLLLTVILLTGTLATISNEIDWLVRPAMRAACGSAWNEDPVSGLIGVQAGPA